jgi:putative ABC transport system ATP-binding protein
MNPAPIIKVDKLNVVYFMGKSNQVNALNDVNLEIYPGEFIIFFGPSGCGKSTLLYAISGLERHIHGDILIDGKNLTNFNTEELDLYRREKIGMIFQAYYLINSLNVLDNVVLPQLSMGVSKGQRLKKATELLDYFGVKIQAKKYPNELSGGQQQRVAICRSLVNDPEIMLADEPTGNLDSKSVQDVMNVLAELNEKQKKTIILVTHSPTLLDYAHRVFYIKDGHVIDTKVNRTLGQKLPPKVAEGAAAAAGGGAATGLNTGSKDLELVTKTLTNLSEAKESKLLLSYKAKEIVSEALTGLARQEIDLLEKEVEGILLGHVNGHQTLAKFLDHGLTSSVFDLNKKSASRLAAKIEEVADEIKILEKQERRVRQGLVPDNNDEVKQVRHYLFDVFDVKIEDPVALQRINDAIKDRLASQIDRSEFHKILDLPVVRGGAGLDNRLARKMARRLELLIRGKI